MRKCIIYLLLLGGMNYLLAQETESKTIVINIADLPPVPPTPGMEDMPKNLLDQGVSRFPIPKEHYNFVRQITNPLKGEDRSNPQQIKAIVLVAADGSVERFSFPGAQNKKLVKAILKDIEQLTFFPALREGVPVACWTELTFHFPNPDFGFLYPQIASTSEDFPDIEEVIETDQQPIPLNLYAVHLKIGYPSKAYRKGIEGLVVARVLVNHNGEYVTHKIMTKAPQILIDAVEEELPSLRMTPAVKEGQAISFWVNIPFRFQVTE